MANVNIGVDIGQKQDPSAVVVAELEKRGDVWHYLIRHLERLPLGTPYPKVAGRVAEVVEKLRTAGHSVQTWVDATGVGQPVVDLLRGVGGLTSVYLTGGDKFTRDVMELRLSKAAMVSRLQVLLQSERVHLPNTPEAAALVDELLTYEIKVSDDGHASFGAFKTGRHDDLATALGLACWEERHGVFFHVLDVGDDKPVPWKTEVRWHRW